MHMSDGGKSGVIRHPFCSVACAKACGENPRPRSVPAVPYYNKMSKMSKVCGPLASGLCVPSKASSPAPLRAELPKKKKSKKEKGDVMSRGERDAKLYLSPPRTPSDSDSDSDTL